MKKLLVHSSRHMAERAIKILGLDPEVWEPWGYHDMLGGQQFEQIVVILTTHPPVHLVRWMKEDLQIKLAPGKRVEFL